MKKYQIFVGIDVSKSKLDVSFLDETNTKNVEHFVVSNDLKGIKSLVSTIKKRKAAELENVLFCLENTGVYSMPPCLFFSENKLDYWVVPAIEIKRSKGISRGKNDKSDSKDIAFYAFTHRHKLTLSELPEKDIQKLKLLIAEREKLMKAIALFDTTNENSDFLPKEIMQSVSGVNTKVLKDLKIALKQIDEQILQVIRENPAMCALSAKRNDVQLKLYYERKVAEGKNPMLVMNNRSLT